MNNGIISVEDFEKVAEVFGIESSVITAIWNTMMENPNNQNEFETIFSKYMTGRYDIYDYKEGNKMENKNNEMVYVTVYADDTGLFTEEECDYCNMIDLIVPYWIAKEWYMINEKENKETTMDELHISEEEATFEKWFNSVYICDDFIGFYDYCIVKGVIPNLLEHENDNKRYRICYEDYNENIQTLFEGTYDECRRYGRMMKWKYSNFESEIGEWKKYDLFLDSCF